MKRRQDSKIRFFFATSLLAVGFCVLLVRLVSLQVVSSEELSQKAKRQREIGVTIEAERGTIYDRRGRILATNVEVPSLYAFPPLVQRPNRTASKLARILNTDQKRIKERLTSGKNFVWIKRKIDPALARDIQELELDGLGFIHESQRFYPKRHLLGQILGFAGMDNQGLEGIELKYDSYLKGSKGLIVLERDAGGRPIFPKGLDYVSLSRGKDLVLTIDEVIQHIAERELDAVMAETSAKSGSVIIIDPNTGEILAMAVRPVFNPNSRRSNNPGKWRNRIVTDTYEPGSTFKVVVAAAALQEKVATAQDLFFCENGRMQIGGSAIHDHLKHGYLTFAQVIQKSSNIGSVKIAMRVGEDRFYRYIRQFGFAEKTGIDLAGEVSGLVRDPDLWSGRSLASVAIGQEVAVTPLQLIMMYGTVANGGWLLRPYLVSEIRDPDGSVTKRFSPKIRRKIIDEETARELIDILEGTVTENGTAQKAALALFERVFFRVAGQSHGQFGENNALLRTDRGYPPISFPADG